MISPAKVDDVSPAAFISFTSRLTKLKSVLFVTFIVGFITGIPSAVIPNLQQSTFGNNQFQITGGIAAGKGLLAFIYNPVIGSISDLHGRKKCLLLTLCASVIPYLAMAITNNFWVYAISDCFFGVYGPSVTLLMAHVADLIPANSGVRTEGFSIALAVFMVGVGGSTFVGVSMSTLMCFTICAGAQTAILIMSYFVLPMRSAEEVPLLVVQEEAGELPGIDHSATAGSKKGGVFIFISFAVIRAAAFRVIDAVKTHRKLRILMAIIFWNYLTQETLEQLLLLYLQNSLNMSQNNQAIVIAIMSGAALLCLTVVITYMKLYFGTVGTLRAALFANFLLSMLYAFATTTWQAMAIPVLSIVGMAVFPCTCAIAAATVSDENSGVVQGIATAARVIAGAICPGLFGLLFQATQSTPLPGTPFVVGAVCVLVALAISRHIED